MSEGGNQRQLLELFELANNYPSPHNGQPMRLKSVSDTQLDLYFSTERGLTATPISYLFSFVTIGVFVRHLELCAEALGHQLTVDLSLPKQERMAGSGDVLCGTITLSFDVHTSNTDLQRLIKDRQTSRKKYTEGLSVDERHHITALTRASGVNAHFLAGKAAHDTIWLNQRAVFDDMFDPAVRTELGKWLRYNEHDKHTKKDGLAYDCMELSGAALKASIEHYKILRWPVVAPLLKQYYLRTMQDNSSVGYFTAPFVSEMDSYNVGRAIIDSWLYLTGQGKYLHPFGTIVSNDTAHDDFCSIAGITNENRTDKYVVFIFRAGSSPRPVESERIPITEQLYNQA